MGIDWITPDMALSILAKVVSLGFITPENVASHGVLQVGCPVFS